MRSAENSVVITGIGAVTAYGIGFDALREGLGAGRRAIAIAGRALVGAEDREVGLVRDLSEFQRRFPQIKPPLPFPLTRMALLAANEAIEHAKLSIADRAGTGIFLNRNRGASTIVVKSAEPMLREGPQRMSPLSFSQSVHNAPLGAVSIHLGLRGPHLLTVGGGAIMLGFEALRRGEANAILCGGIDEIEATTLPALETLSYLGTRERPGATMGEGAMMCLLERADHAQKRGAQPLAEIASVAFNPDSAVDVIDEQDIECWGRPTGAGLSDAFLSVLDDAQLRVDEVDLYIGSANGASVIDDAERDALDRIGLRDIVPKTLKSHIGECFGMAAAASVAWAADCLNRGEIARFAPRVYPGTEAPTAHALVSNVENHALYFTAVLRKRFGP